MLTNVSCPYWRMRVPAGLIVILLKVPEHYWIVRREMKRRWLVVLSCVTITFQCTLVFLVFVSLLLVVNPNRVCTT